ncbi:MAG: hypothetical protein WBM90_12295 [Acidimicrobiia bacterium]
MLTSINPLGERSRGQRFWLTATWYVTGSVLGGVILGLAAGYLGTLLPRGDWRGVVALVAVISGAGFDLLRKQPPSIHRQVNEDWLSRYRGWVYGSGFGFQLGIGITTIVPSASFYSILILMMLSGEVLAGALIGGIFGLTRASVIGAVARINTPGALREMMRRMQKRLELARVAVVAAQLFVAAAVATALATTA